VKSGWILLVGASLAAGACARTEDAPPSHVPRADVRLAVETRVTESTVPRNATLDRLLRDHHLQESLVNQVVDAARDVFDVRQLRAERPYRLEVSLDGLLREFTYQIDADRFLRIVNKDRAHPETMEAKVVPYEKTTTVEAIDATIDSSAPSLIAAIDNQGENLQLALELADIFSGEVDFRSELQPGDRVRVLFEKSTHDGEFSGYGAVLGASLDLSGRRLQAYRWTDPASGGKASYYDENGRSLKRFFLKSPLKFIAEPRITSAFSLHRLHPIDHVVKAHLGVDYHAAAGDPVVAVASGVVESAAYSGAGGNMVHLKHPDGYETYYLHLSSFGPGVHAGAHVTQGEVIGHVGATGAATGPHLDFRLKKNGQFVNPVAVHSSQSPGEPIPATELAAYRAARATVSDRLSATLLASAAPAAKGDAVAAVGQPRK
jgi:murein DD-endopeptidase MepM/ murein hydrolase activator NlpD